MNYRYSKTQPVYDSKKTKKESKPVFTCNRDIRDDFIKKFGKKEFERVCLEDERMNKLQDIPVPTEYSWLFEQFINIWYNTERDFNGNVIFTPRTILDYEQFIGISFSYKERKLLLSMKTWAQTAIVEVERDK